MDRWTIELDKRGTVKLWGKNNPFNEWACDNYLFMGTKIKKPLYFHTFIPLEKTNQVDHRFKCEKQNNKFLEYTGKISKHYTKISS